MPKILLIIPAYNESERIISLVDSVQAYIEKSELHIDYLVINDGSTDSEEALLLRHHIRHIELIQNLGIGAAMQTGYKYALENDYDFAVQFDGDGQHDLGSLLSLMTPLLKGEADFVVGSRFISGSQSEYKSSFLRRQGIRLISKTIRLFSGLRVEDPTSGYRACNRKVIEYFAERYPLKYPEPESCVQLAKKGIVLKEVGANMVERKTGSSSIRSWNAVTYMFYVLTSVIILSFEKEEK